MRLGLIGYPVSHSWSPRLFARFSERDGIPVRYDLFPMPDVSVLRSFLRENPDIVGLNVTIPHKKAVLSLCDVLHPSAERVGAVNTLLIQRCVGTRDEVHITGYNTDVGGFASALVRAMTEAAPVPAALVPAAPGPARILKNRRALILGSGGSARAVAWALRDLGVSFDLVGRAKNGAADSKVFMHAMDQSSDMQGLAPQGASTQGLAPQGAAPQGASTQGLSPQGASTQGLSPQGAAPQGAAPQGAAPQGAAPQGAAPQGAAPQGAAPQGAAPQGAAPQSMDAFAGALRFSYDTLDSVPWPCYDLVVHCTPLGMEPSFSGQRVPINLSYCSPSILLFDLVYTPETTPLMQYALDCGLQVCGGIGMLEQQAEEAWYVWKTATRTCG